MLPSTTKYSVTKTRKNGNKFSITYLSNFKNNSILNGETIEQERNKRITYIDSFQFLLSMEKNKYNSKIK